MLPDASGLGLIDALIDSLRWFFSPEFRASKRESWRRDGARSMIAEAGMWFATWFAIVAIGSVATAVWLSDPGNGTSANEKTQHADGK